jgi:hypothetical protein
MKMRAKGFLDFSMDRLTERNKENSFLDVDWIIEELLALGQHRLAIEEPMAAASASPDLSPQTSSSQTSEKLSTKTAAKMKAETAKSGIGQKSGKRVVSTMSRRSSGLPDGVFLNQKSKFG